MIINSHIGNHFQLNKKLLNMNSEQMHLNKNQYFINDINFEFSNENVEICDYKNLLTLESLLLALLCACLFFLL